MFCSWAGIFILTTWECKLEQSVKMPSTLSWMKVTSDPSRKRSNILNYFTLLNPLLYFVELCYVNLNEKTSSHTCNRHNSHLCCFNFHSMGAPVMVELEGQTDPLQIAMKELK